MDQKAEETGGVSRRGALAGAVAAFSAVPALSASAKGPIVWNGMDQKELDDAYDQSVYAPNAKLLSQRRDVANKLVLKSIGAPQVISYGPTPEQTLEVYRTKASKPPIVFFIHGGAWKSTGSDASKNAFMVETFLNEGAMVVMPNFIGVVEAGGDLMVVAEQVRAATAYTLRNAEALGGDPQRFFVLGHSSGGHLGGVVLTTDWAARGLPATPFRGALLGSGMYDLKAVRLSKRANYVAFTDASEEELSAQRHIDRLRTPLILTYGLEETPEFQRQSRDFYAAVKAAGKPVELHAGEGFNHYETQETLGNPYGFMGRLALRLIKGGVSVGDGSR